MLSSPRRTDLPFLRGGSAACGNSELKVRHKYGAKRVLKLLFFPSPCVVLLFSESKRRRNRERERDRESERGCKTGLACAFLQSAARVHRPRERRRESSSFSFSPRDAAIFSDSSIGNKASLSFFFYFSLAAPPPPPAGPSPPPAPRTPRLGSFCKMRHAFL